MKVALALVFLVGCGATILNSSPGTGGACGDGDMLATPCGTGCCRDGFTCLNNRDCMGIDPAPDPNDLAKRPRDAGVDAR